MSSALHRVEPAHVPSLCILPLPTHVVAEPSADPWPESSAQQGSRFPSAGDVTVYLRASYCSVFGTIPNQLLAVHRLRPRGGTYWTDSANLIACIQAWCIAQRPFWRPEWDRAPNEPLACLKGCVVVRHSTNDPPLMSACAARGPPESSSTAPMQRTEFRLRGPTNAYQE